MSDWREWMQQQAKQAKHPALQAYYERFDLDPEQSISETPLIALDLETSGLDPRRDAILSMGVVPFSLQRIPLSMHREWLLRPPLGFAEQSVAHHGITHSDVSASPEFLDVLPALLEQCAGRLCVVHYHPIEREFLDRAVRHRLGSELRFPLIDTMALEARLHRTTWQAKLQQWMGRTPPSLRLAASRSRYGLPAYRSHRASIDALATAELLQAQIQHHYSSTTALNALWL